MTPKLILGFLIAFLIADVSLAQTKHAYSTSDQSDPEAKAILDKLKGRYKSFKTLEADFTLTIEFPEEEPVIQKGTLTQAGDKFRVEMKDQAIISDGNTLWFHQKLNNEVQINNVDEMGEGELLSPKTLLHIYESDKYIYALTNQFVENGIAIQQVEFKPVDKDSEYSKIRLSIDKKKNQMLNVKAFGKSGSRFTFELNQLNPDKNFEVDFFQFNPAKYPGIHVEDLRID